MPHSCCDAQLTTLLVLCVREAAVSALPPSAAWDISCTSMHPCRSSGACSFFLQTGVLLALHEECASLQLLGPPPEACPWSGSLPCCIVSPFATPRQRFYRSQACSLSHLKLPAGRSSCASSRSGRRPCSAAASRWLATHAPGLGFCVPGEAAAPAEAAGRGAAAIQAAGACLRLLLCVQHARTM